LVHFAARHLPELGLEGSVALVETTLLMAMTAWPCSRPSEAVQNAYASDPALADMRIDFTDLVRRTAAVTASGLLARQETAQAGPIT
ncbi:TetR/AcrR family transcriptional regulator, partial [Streptomyces sp. NPDC005070]